MVRACHLRGICRMLDKRRVWGRGKTTRTVSRMLFAWNASPHLEGVRLRPPLRASSFLLRFLFVSSPFPRDVPTLFFYLLCSLLFAGEYHEWVKRRRGQARISLVTQVESSKKPRAQTSEASSVRDGNERAEYSLDERKESLVGDDPR